MRRAVMAVLLSALVAPLFPAVAHADAVREAQWHLDYLDLDTAHQSTRGGGVTVAVIDTGVDATHPDLRDNLLPGVDLVDPDHDDAWTPENHGTFVAGVLGGHGHGPGNADGVLGVAPATRILPIRAAAGGDDDRPTSQLIPEAIDQAVASGASVISISLATEERSELDARAVAAARRSDVVIVAAAGNRPDADVVTFPAALPGVVAAGGVDQDGDHADFSVTGPEITLAAPAADIVTTGPDGEYAVVSGTSFAAPIVAGAAALVRSLHPRLSADEVVHRLVSTASDAGPSGEDERYGHGIVDIVAALTADVPPMPPPEDLPDDARQAQWHLEFLDLPAVHEITTGEGVTVAVVDTGVDATHPDLHQHVLPGIDLVEPGNRDAWTPGGHGTALAGIIGGHGNRLVDHEPGNRGVLGVAPAAAILPVRVVGSDLDDREAIELAAEGIRWAAANGADIICYAAGSVSRDLFAEAVEAARAADVVLVAAAGDRPNATEIWFPAANPAVVAAVGVDRDGRHAEDSLTGPEVSLAAPSVEIHTTAPERGYTDGAGTSAAAAVIAGAAALVRARFPDLPAEQVVHRLLATADDAGPPGHDERYGHGVLDIVAALTADVPPPTAGAGGATGAAPPPPRDRDPGSLGTALLAVAGLIVIAITTAIILGIRRRRGRDAGAAADTDHGTGVAG